MPNRSQIDELGRLARQQQVTINLISKFVSKLIDFIPMTEEAKNNFFPFFISWYNAERCDFQSDDIVPVVLASKAAVVAQY